MTAGREPEPPAGSVHTRQAEVGVPADGDRDAATSGRCDRRVHVEAVVVRRDSEVDPVREGEGRAVDVDGGPQPRHPAPDAGRLHPPARRAHEEAVDREAVGIEGEGDAVEVDVDAGGPVTAGRQAVGPRSEQRQTGRRPGAQRGDAAGDRQVLLAAEPQRDTRHADAGDERRDGVAGPQRDRRDPAEPPLLDFDRHRNLLDQRASCRAQAATLETTVDVGTRVGVAQTIRVVRASPTMPTSFPALRGCRRRRDRCPRRRRVLPSTPRVHLPARRRAPIARRARSPW